MFFWIEGIPPEINHRTSAQLQAYITRTIHTHIPSESDDLLLHNLVKKLQSHCHSNYCLRSSQTCRFGFPKPECCETAVFPHEVTCRKNKKARLYETYRPKDSLYVNAYNPQILRHWRANMDIQLINDAAGAAYYVCHYLCKSEPDELQCALSNLINTVFRQNPEITVFQRLWNIGLCVLKNRRVSAQEAAFRLSHLQLLQCSRTVVYINTRPQSKRFKMLRPMSEIIDLHDNDTDTFRHNLVDYYCARPCIMENMSLFQFASWYIKCPPPTNTCNRRNWRLQRFYIEKYNVRVRKRRSPVVIRFPCFSISNDDYYYSLLMLLLPFHSESDLLGDFATAKDALNQNIKC